MLVGTAGTVLLTSAIVKRPLLMTMVRFTRRRNGELTAPAPVAANDFERRLWTAPTSVLGDTLLVNALATITLAGIVIAIRLVQRRLVEVGALADKAPKRVTDDTRSLEEGGRRGARTRDRSCPSAADPGGGRAG